MNAYEWKQERRRERLEARAAKLNAEGRAKVDGAWASLRQIPPGQPILVGHHSEKRHRAHIARVDRSLSKGFALMDAAAEAARRAASVGDGGISSDDPDAVNKLGDKVETLEALRDGMKAANAHWRKHGTLAGAPVTPEVLAKAEKNIAHALHWYPKNKPVPFPSYTLTNLGARIRDAKARAARIVTVQAMDATTEAVNGCTIAVDPEENRITLKFPARLSRDAYKVVRSYGFLWSPTRNGFTRKIGANARWAATDLAKKFGVVPNLTEVSTA